MPCGLRQRRSNRGRFEETGGRSIRWRGANCPWRRSRLNICPIVLRCSMAARRINAKATGSATVCECITCRTPANTARLARRRSSSFKICCFNLVGALAPLERHDQGCVNARTQRLDQKRSRVEVEHELEPGRRFRAQQRDHWTSREGALHRRGKRQEFVVDQDDVPRNSGLLSRSQVTISAPRRSNWRLTIDRSRSSLRRCYELARDAIGFPGPDIVRSDAEEMVRYVVEHITHERQDVMIRRRPDIHDVIRAFKAFVACRIPQQTIGAFDDREYLLARRRRIAADDMFDAGVADEVITGRVILGNDAAGVTDVSSRREIEIGTVVNFVAAIKALLRISRPMVRQGPYCEHTMPTGIDGFVICAFDCATSR